MSVAPGEVSNASDVTGDGIINFEDFGVLAAAWRGHDPNDPAWLNDPGLVDPNAVAVWNGSVDYDGDYEIGLGDLVYFAEDAYWLWEACWRAAGEDIWAMGASAMEVMLVEQPAAVVEERSVVEQYAQAVEISQWLENIWKNDTELRAKVDKKDWKRVVDAVDDWMSELESGL